MKLWGPFGFGVELDVDGVKMSLASCGCSGPRLEWQPLQEMTTALHHGVPGDILLI